ncbi:MAG: lysophospholipid acyltransferase family protein [Parabacteroides sp.]|nr:lysophospholipid acyltransferase family protein [Parabacteroides sp.]MBQ8530495.1 lysophospholipid acyltransferase family protein [Parabacteroides sp.]
MKKAISKAILRLIGWKLGPMIEDIPKCVICVAPHTSNWDFLLGEVFYTSIGRHANFLIKKEWFFFPFNYIFNWLGGVPVDRGKRTSVTDQMVEQFKTRERFQLAVTPEGTRKRAKEWKKGFYYIAQKANVPIAIVYFDYKKKEVGYKGVFHVTGNMEQDIREIRAYYRGVTARHPENFVEI